MKVVIAGSRKGFTAAEVAREIKASGFNITLVICGEAAGVDSLGKQWAIKNGIPYQSFAPDWEAEPRLAGFIRNSDMNRIADGLIVLIFNRSKGSSHMLQIATKKGIPVHTFFKDTKKLKVNFSIEEL